MKKDQQHFNTLKKIFLFIIKWETIMSLFI